MTVTFAKNWNWNYDDKKTVIFNGKPFGFDEARGILRKACVHPNGTSLKNVIDTGTARVIVGPHKSAGDSRLHMTVHCKNINTTYHVYMSAQGNVSGIDRENPGGVKPKTGHALDEPNQPAIANSAAL